MGVELPDKPVPAGKDIPRIENDFEYKYDSFR